MIELMFFEILLPLLTYKVWSNITNVVVVMMSEKLTFTGVFIYRIKYKELFEKVSPLFTST